jgi:hypothetical protein
VIDAGGIAPILQASAQKLSEPNAPPDIAQQHHVDIRYIRQRKIRRVSSV